MTLDDFVERQMTTGQFFQNPASRLGIDVYLSNGASPPKHWSLSDKINHYVDRYWPYHIGWWLFNARCWWQYGAWRWIGQCAAFIHSELWDKGYSCHDCWKMASSQWALEIKEIEERDHDPLEPWEAADELLAELRRSS